MNDDKKLQAKQLYFQTQLNKSEIAAMLHISRRSLYTWVKEGNWERLKHAAEHMPSILAENCYHIFGHLTEHFLSERRLTNPVSNKDADTLHKLVLTINKLKGRTSLNENMEVLALFFETVKKQNPNLANDLLPYMDQFLTRQASIYTRSVAPESFTEMNRLPYNKEIDYTEQQLDQKELFDLDNAEMDALEAIQRFKANLASPTETEPPLEIPQDTFLSSAA